MATLKQNNEDVWDYTPSVARAAGEVVLLGRIIGVVSRPIAANAKGAINTRGIFTFDKVTGGALTAGNVAYLHPNGRVTGTAGTSGIAGLVAVDAAAADVFVDVSINHGMLYDLNVTGP
jgi:predicted RecA/RadA family phage recombinase